jgi:glycosyltransferase involved in cell wall biosynthesis
VSAVPLVSVVVPVYNRASSVGHALETALAQTYPRVETIVVDDGSTDDIAGVVGARFPSVRLLRLERNSGAAAARNAGVAAARGELIAFLDSDDLWSPEKLALQVPAFLGRPDACLSFTDVAIGPAGVDARYSRVQPPRAERPVEQLLEGNPILTPSTVVVRRSDLDAVGGFCEALRHSADRDLWLRLAPRGPLHFVDLPLVRRVVRSDSMWYGGTRWHRDAVRILHRYLERPEGRRRRRDRRALEAWEAYRLGTLAILQEKYALGGSLVTEALSRDPVVGVRRRRGVLLGVFALAKLCSAPIGRPMLGGAPVVVMRLLRALLQPGASLRPAPAPPVEFRPPPDAPPE